MDVQVYRQRHKHPFSQHIRSAAGFATGLHSEQSEFELSWNLSRRHRRADRQPPPYLRAMERFSQALLAHWNSADYRKPQNQSEHLQYAANPGLQPGEYEQVDR